MYRRSVDVTKDNQPSQSDMDKENDARNSGSKRARISNQSDLLEDVTENIANVAKEGMSAPKVRKKSRLEVETNTEAKKIDRRDSSDTEPTWDLQSGCLKRIVLRNFLCHHELVYGPHERINFISGLNGSGKSAVLAGVVFALGGSARVSGRGTTNKGLIRTGQSSASVEVTLWNGGDNPYRSDVYGETITIIRTVSQGGGGGYKIKNEQGKFVSERGRIKEELDRILAAFGIQVDNPIAVLNQDEAKSFLHRCDPHKMYSFFMRATQLEDCKNDYVSAAEEKRFAEEKLEEKTTAVPTLKAELISWERKLQMHQSIASRRDSMKSLQGELAWSMVTHVETELTQAQAQLSGVQKKMDKCNELATREEEQENALRNEKGEIEKSIQELATTAGALEDETKRLGAEYARCKEGGRRANKDIRESKAIVDTKRRDLETLQLEIDRLRTDDGEEFGRLRAARNEKISKLEKSLENVHEELSTTQTHVANLQSNKDALQEEAFSCRGKLERIRGQSKLKESELHQLVGRQGGARSARDTRLILFGEDMVRLAAAVEQAAAAGRFAKAPVGPVGAEINIREFVSQEQAQSITFELRSLLTAFIVDSFADHRVISDLQRKCRTNFQVITQRFTETPHNVSSGRCSHPTFRTVLDCLEVKDANVINALIDQRRVEQVLLVPDDRAAQEMLKAPHSVPPNCHYAISDSHYQYYPAPNYRSYALRNSESVWSTVERQARNILHSRGAEEMVARLRVDLQGLKREAADADRAVAEAKKRAGENDAQLGSATRKCEDLKKRIRVMNTDVEKLRTESATERPPDVAALEEDMDRQREDFAAAERRVEEVEREHEKVLQEMEEARVKKEEADAKRAEHMERSEPLSESLTRLESRLRKCAHNKEHYRDRLRDYSRQIGEADGVVQSKNKLLKEQTEKATKFSEERIDSSRTAEKIHRELRRLEDSIRQQENDTSLESLNVVLENVERLRKQYKMVRKRLTRMGDEINQLAAILKERTKGYKVIRASVCRRVSMNFAVRLNARHFSGDLVFDHSDHTLSVNVNPEGGESSLRAIGTLSGGEKSYATVALVLALWDAMEPPFRMLDEFDVFMDMVNRRAALQQIVDYARESRRFQYVLLTPLSTDSIKVDEDISITRLEKSQQ